MPLGQAAGMQAMQAGTDTSRDTSTPAGLLPLIA